MNKAIEHIDSSFISAVIQLYGTQYKLNRVYNEYVHKLGRGEQIQSLAELTFLPISFFKSREIKTGDWNTNTVFYSSGTGSGNRARHQVKSVEAYLHNTRKGFSEHYGDPHDYCFMALLPSYLEQKHSSLICMVDDLIVNSRFDESGYFLYDFERLNIALEKCKRERKPTILLGVSYALLDYSEDFQHDFPDLIVMETGGMKGRREELIREELHLSLSSSFGVPRIHSEYGMCELSSQAYSKGKGLFTTSSSLAVLAVDIYDPLSLTTYNTSARLAFIDLANEHSCAFILTDDIGKVYPDGRFEVLGRMDASEVRGCNLMV